ncbi:hypothetical protein P8F81_14545 [Kosakonia cowanii]|uniref:hypothetical protein n=1 Tax=Kosakonia cowanii TaxID=208223 RepID=UPI002DDD3F28|nr:hypothetical protein [Kosakonia cowanii]WRY57861.1 hypothetical protein P8F81_14545 [Kosakonia cowanii]
MNNSYIFEPIDFLFAGSLFKGFSVGAAEDILLLDTLTDAYRFAFGQDLPPPYTVWNDIIENFRNQLRGDDKFDDAEKVINEYLGEQQAQHADQLIEYRKKRIRKNNTQYDDFVFSDAREDAYFVLSTVAINRLLGDCLRNGLLEKIFACYKRGGWPCGVKGQQLIVFNPSVLTEL